MRRIAFCAALLFLVVSLSQLALAQDDEFSIGLRTQAVDKPDSAKFEEYRSLEGATGELGISLWRDTFTLELESEDIGSENQRCDISGMVGKILKFRLYYNGIPHNYSYNAKTFYGGAGGNELTYPVANADPASLTADYSPTVSTSAPSWNVFDYSVMNKDIGGEVVVSQSVRYYFKIGANRLASAGVKPLGAASGVFADKAGLQASAFGNMVELPEPVDYVTVNSFAEAGYRQGDLCIAIDGGFSEFKNENEYLSWRNPYVTTQNLSEATGLAPNNRTYKIGGDLSWVDLPFNSSLVAKFDYSRLLSNFTIRSEMPDSTSGSDGPPATSPAYHTDIVTLSRANFEGDVSVTRYGLHLSCRPTRDFSSNIFFSRLEKSNASSVIEFASEGLTTTNRPFEYDKDSAGLELSYNLPKHTKIKGGLEWLSTDRNRDDISATEDRIFLFKIENAASEVLQAKVGYKHTLRKATFDAGNAGTSLVDPQAVERFVRRYDATDKSTDEISLGLELYPASFADLGLEYSYKGNSYDETLLGRTKDHTHSAYLDSVFRLPAKVTLNARVGYESSKLDSFHRNITSGDSVDPGAGTAGGAYNWLSAQEDNFWSVGLGAEVSLLDSRLCLLVSWDYQKSDGQSLLSRQDSAVDLGDITSSDDYTRQLFNVKAVYAFTKKFEMTAGLIYDDFSYDDLQYDGYTYVSPASTNTTSFLTGAYSDYNYKAILAYIAAKISY